MNVNTLFPSKYLKAADLGDREVIVTIRAVTLEDVGHGAERERKLALTFEKATKLMLVNRTNAMIVAALYGDETDDWKGKRITIYPTRVKAFGTVQDAIRVREEIPAQPKPVAQAAQVEEASEIDDTEDYTDEAA